MIFCAPAVVAAKVQVTLFGISYSGASLKDTSEVLTTWLMRILDRVPTLYNYFPHEIRTLH